VTVEFDDITSLIGPNDAGKSSVLRALDWGLNGTNPLSEKDVSSYAEPEEQWIEVAVTFTDFEPSEREAIGDLFLPAGADSLTVSRSWQDGKESATCLVNAYPPFASVRDRSLSASKALEAYKALQKDETLMLPAVSSRGKADTAMREWEQAHSDQLVLQPVDASGLIGPKGVIAKFFEYVFVSVDMRAGEQSRESKGSLLSRLAGSIDKKEYENRIQELDLRVQRARDGIVEELQAKTNALSSGLSEEASKLCAGRDIYIDPVAKRQRPSIELELRVKHGSKKSGLERQGHGFQRTAMLAALLHLAHRDQEDDVPKAVMVAIEEPEIYQNPIQSRSLASSLKERATAPGSRFSVLYATHSPVFIDPHKPDQVRRLSRSRTQESGLPPTAVHRYSRRGLDDRIAERHRPRGGIDKQIFSMLNEDFVEGFFAEAVIIVEGETDKVVIEEVASRKGALERFGVTVVNASGKANLIIAQAILAQLGIKSLTVFDNDSGNAERDWTDPDEIARAHASDRDANKVLQEHHEAPTVLPFPVGKCSQTLFAWDDNLEHVVSSSWAAWEKTMDAVCDELEAKKTKRPALYRLTARRCEGPISPVLLEVLTLARALTTL
jgi:predicted ATP-dependent endonuclease of OLD family